MIRRRWLVVELGALAAALVTAVGVPAAYGKPGARVKLSVLPLPKSTLGPAAKSLALQRDSGVLVNGGGNTNLAGKLYIGQGLPTTPNRAFIPTGPAFDGLGRVSGYALDYGLGASGGGGVTEVRTGVDLYETVADAKRSLSFWHQNERRVTDAGGGGLTIAIKKEKVARVGSSRFALLVSYSAANIAPLFGVDEQFSRGRYAADVTVWAGTAAAAERLAPKLARKLDARIRRALAGRLHAKPVKLPAKQKAGPPPGGPDLAPLALQTTDLSGKATALVRNYWVGGPLSPFAVSEFYVAMNPAGQFGSLGQEIQWFATANQASFEADVAAAVFGNPIDLSSLGDGARGALANGGSGDSTGNAELVFSSGRLEEFVFFSSSSAIQVSEVQSIAEKVAHYIDAAGLRT